VAKGHADRGGEGIAALAVPCRPAPKSSVVRLHGVPFDRAGYHTGLVIVTTQNGIRGLPLHGPDWMEKVNGGEDGEVVPGHGQLPPGLACARRTVGQPLASLSATRRWHSSRYSETLRPQAVAAALMASFSLGASRS